MPWLRPEVLNVAADAVRKQLTKLLCILFAEHGWYPLAFGAFVGDQRREPIPRGDFQYFFHPRTAPLTEWHIRAVASPFF
jgi:hypothetical protein